MSAPRRDARLHPPDRRTGLVGRQAQRRQVQELKRLGRKGIRKDPGTQVDAPLAERAVAVVDQHRGSGSATPTTAPPA